MKKYAYGYVYIMTNRKNGTLHVGVTQDLYTQIRTHKTTVYVSIIKKYKLSLFVYIEQYSSMVEAMAREKGLKAGSKKVKVDLITSINPEWKDLAEEWY